MVTHGSFVHFFFDKWDGVPGRSGSRGYSLENGEAIPMTLASRDLRDEGFCMCPLGVLPSPDIWVGEEDVSDVDKAERDCGIFTPDHLR